MPFFFPSYINSHFHVVYKATTEAEGKAKAPQPASSVELSPPDVEHKAKAAHQLLRDFPSTDPSLLAKDIQKKRDRPATSAPAAKKLFRDDAPSKIEKRQ